MTQRPVDRDWPGPARRAPRLDPDTHIAPHLDRGRGRFRRIDPLRARPLPSVAKLLGALAWAGLLGASLRRAWNQHREPHAHDR